MHIAFTYPVLGLLTASSAVSLYLHYLLVHDQVHGSDIYFLKCSPVVSYSMKSTSAEDLSYMSLADCFSFSMWQCF